MIIFWLPCIPFALTYVWMPGQKTQHVVQLGKAGRDFHYRSMPWLESTMMLTGSSFIFATGNLGSSSSIKSDYWFPKSGFICLYLILTAGCLWSIMYPFFEYFFRYPNILIGCSRCPSLGSVVYMFNNATEKAISILLVTDIRWHVPIIDWKRVTPVWSRNGVSFISGWSEGEQRTFTFLISPYYALWRHITSLVYFSRLTFICLVPLDSRLSLPK